MFIGFNLTFLIQHVMGLDGMPRRVYEYSNTGHLALYNMISTVGAFVLAFGILLTIINVARSLKVGAIAGPDPWKGNTLEWFTTSPPPVNNFDIVPRVRSVEPMKDIRREIERRTSGACAESGHRAGGRSPDRRLRRVAPVNAQPLPPSGAPPAVGPPHPPFGAAARASRPQLRATTSS